MAYRERIRSRAATPGEVKTLEYLTDAFHRLGLEPAAGSSYLQPAPLVEITASAERGLEWGRKQQEEYTAERYHEPSDEYRSGVDLRGSLEDLQLLYASRGKARCGEDLSGLEPRQ